MWSTLSGGGHTAAAPGAASQRKADAWQSQRAHLDALLTAHESPVDHAQPPRIPPPAPVARAEVRRELQGEATNGLPRWRVGAWLRARRKALDHLDAEVAARQQAREAEHAQQQADADAWWAQLLANHESVVLNRIEQAFHDHAMPATPTAVDAATAFLVMPVDTPERLIGKREPTITDKGNLSLAIMTKTRRHELYVQAICSAIIAVAAEAFAVAPGLEAVEVAVVEPDHPAGPAVLALSELRREVVLPDGAQRPQVSDLVLASEEGRVRLVLERSGQARAPRPLPPDDPSVDLLLDILEVDG